MNDLRSRNRSLAPVRELGPKTGEIVSAPPRQNPRHRANPLFESSREAVPEDEESPEASSSEDDNPLSFPVSRELRAMPTIAPSAEADDDESDEVEMSTERADKAGPSSRPSRRRECADLDALEDDKFPWHYQFNDDEPEELQATSPLLSRAFRSSVG